MTDFSLPIINVLLGGGQDELLENCHKNFLDGDGSAMMTALIACSLYQLKIPDWVADELLTLDNKLAAGKLSDMNEFFNYKPTHQAKLGANKRTNQSESKVLGALFNHRINGGNFTCADGLQAVAEETGEPRKTVEGVYKENKDWFKAIPNKKDENHGYAKTNLPPLLELAKINRNRK